MARPLLLRQSWKPYTLIRNKKAGIALTINHLNIKPENNSGWDEGTLEVATGGEGGPAV